jgi:hypothetical protein
LGSAVGPAQRDDGAVDLSAADEQVLGAGFHFEYQEPSFVSDEPCGRLHGGALWDGFQMVDGNTRADADCAWRQMILDGFCRGDFHEADHRGRGENRGKVWIVCGDGPLKFHDALDSGVEILWKVRKRVLRRSGFVFCSPICAGPRFGFLTAFRCG